MMMIDYLKKMIGIAPKVDYDNLIKNGAVIIDVRTNGEYAEGHVTGSINIPLDQLSNNMSKLKKDKVVITCCASGMRSGIAKKQLIKNGFVQVYNGGSWMRLNKYK